jgi:hypothetical protein
MMSTENENLNSLKESIETQNTTQEPDQNSDTTNKNLSEDMNHKELKSNTCDDEKINVQFGTDDESDNDDDNNDNKNTKKEEDLSKYTVVDADHLDEDLVIPGQEFCLFSFMSPEGIMNCNVRAVKFRGAFRTMDAAMEKARELEKTDKYFKIFIGESGKWLEFDPPSIRVEREMSSNKEQQRILDEQRKQNMKKINKLAEEHKKAIDKKDKGKKERINESKKAGAANDAVEKQRAKKQEKVEKQEEKKKTAHANSRAVATENARARLRKRLAQSQNKKAMEKLENNEKTKTTEANNNKIDTKIKVVGKISGELEDNKTKLATADKNIENIKKLMAARRANKNNC